MTVDEQWEADRRADRVKEISKQFLDNLHSGLPDYPAEKSRWTYVWLIAAIGLVVTVLVGIYQ